MKWRIVVSGKEDPYMNMAIDEAIYQGVSDGSSAPTIRFYDWQPATFSCGYNQVKEKEIDSAKLASSEYLFVRRPTGGRLVLHEDEVTYSVIAPLKGIVSGNVTETYYQVSKALLRGLKLLCIDAELEKGALNSSEQKQQANPCFSSSSRYEINYQRKKIIGSAQTRNRKAFLQHGSILRTINQKKVADFLPNISEDNRQRIASYLERRTISMNRILERQLSFNEAVESFIKGFEQEWSGESFFSGDRLEILEETRAIRLRESKYVTREWNEKKGVEQKGFDIDIDLNSCRVR